MGETLIHRRVAMAREGTNPYALCRVKSGWVVAGDVQPVEAYCLLLPDPVVPSLNDLADEDRAQFLADMALIGDVLLKLDGVWRVNYEILGNLEPALHAHVVPRRLGEPEAYRTKPIWSYDWEAARKFDPVRDAWWAEQVRVHLSEPRG